MKQLSIFMKIGAAIPILSFQMHRVPNTFYNPFVLSGIFLKMSCVPYLNMAVKDTGMHK